MEKAAFEIPLWSPPVNSKIAARVASLILLLLGAVGIVWASSALLKGNASRHWQPVAGKVLAFQWHTPGEGPDYPTIEYAFEFKGIHHTGSRIAFGPAPERSPLLAGLVAGGPVTVYVDPARPKEAVLEPGASQIAAAGLAISAGLFLLGVCVPFIARMGRARQK